MLNLLLLILMLFTVLWSHFVMHMHLNFLSLLYGYSILILLIISEAKNNMEDLAINRKGELIC